MYVYVCNEDFTVYTEGLVQAHWILKWFIIYFSILFDRCIYDEDETSHFNRDVSKPFPKCCGLSFLEVYRSCHNDTHLDSTYVDDTNVDDTNVDDQIEAEQFN